jgi:hypothetical protein
MTRLHVLVLPHVPSLMGDATLLTRLTNGSLSQQAGVQPKTCVVECLVFKRLLM